MGSDESLNILFLSSWFPYPPNNGSKLRIYNLLRGLAEHHALTLLSFADRSDVDPNAPALRSLVRDLHVIPWKPFTPHRWRARIGFFSLTPRSVADTYSPEMALRIEQSLSTRNYDLVIASQITMAGYAPCFRGLPALFEEVEVGVLYEQFTRATSPWRRFRYGLTWAKHRRYLARLLRHFQACTVVSEQERKLLSQAVSDHPPIEIIPNGVNLSDYENVHEEPEPNTLIFTGAFTYGANHDAMTWFVGQVYPLIRAQAPDVHLYITGNHADKPLPPADGVTRTGYVDDVRPLVARSWISLAPLRIGGGTRLKILESMALRTPVVATSKGAEGLDVQDGEHLLIADTPQTFADAVIRLLKDPALRRRLTDNAYQLVREKYDWAVIMPRFLDLVERVANGITTGNC